MCCRVKTENSPKSDKSHELKSNGFTRLLLLHFVAENRYDMCGMLLQEFVVLRVLHLRNNKKTKQ